MKCKSLLLFAVFLFFPTTASAQFEKIFDLVKKDEQPSDDRVASGLKEALLIGTENAVKQTGTLDGYFKNEAIKILMPEKLQKMDKMLRFAGFGPKLDEFVMSMNRAAENAAPLAKDIFWGAIKEMSIMDAHSILTGGDTAATDYFREKTTGDLTETFKPIVKDALDDVGATRQYKDLVGRFERMPFVSSQSLDLDEYVVGKALDGLFFGELYTCLPKTRGTAAVRLANVHEPLQIQRAEKNPRSHRGLPAPRIRQEDRDRYQV